MTTIRTFIETAKGLLKNPFSLAIFAALYALLLATAYFFIATREATLWQVIVTLAGLIVIPLEFFVLQALIVGHAQQTKISWRGILHDALKLLAVTIPILVLGYGLWILLNRWQMHFPVPPRVPVFETLHGPPQRLPLHWPTLLFATARCLLFGVALPLLTIHLWIEVAGHELRAMFAGGAKSILKRIGNICARAFQSDSVFIYALGLVFFVLVPYALLFIPITIKGNKTEFAFFVVRLLLVFVFTLFGWIVTVNALARNALRAPEARQNVAPSVSPGEPALQNT